MSVSKPDDSPVAPIKKTLRPVDHNTLGWKLFLVYDVIMMLVIILNMISLFVDAIVLSHFSEWLAVKLHFTDLRTLYIQSWHPWIVNFEMYFICFLIIELAVRWVAAIVYHHHKRWWFFPILHIYEFLAIIPQLRFLRLLRVGVIIYRLHEIGYRVLPDKMVRQLEFYYEVVMEELSDRVVLTVIGQVEKELDNSTTHHDLIHNLIDHHRQAFSDVLAETLQQSLATALAKHQYLIRENIGQIVHRSVQNTPELTQLLKLMPFVGSRIEELIQAIGQRLGENISQGIMNPIVAKANLDTYANPLLSEVAAQVSQVPLDSDQLDQFVESVIRESLQGLKKQVKIKHWEQML